MLKFPYGLADFYKIITEGYYYLDRTNHIRQLEEMGSTLLFLRPRRFGKSLLLSTLENYYDLRRADEFERLFGQLAIGENPTVKHNQYFILKWNFSTVFTSGTEVEFRQALYNHLNNSINEFNNWYDSVLPHHVEINPTDGIASFNNLLALVRTTPYKLYLLIDEYDNFANELLMNESPQTGNDTNNKARYETLIQGEGLLKLLFKAIKAGLEGRGLDRVFMTGVSPIVMSDLSSGFNIAENIYLKPQLNDLCGFHETEVIIMLERVSQQCGLTAEETEQMLTLMRLFYNGYTFSPELAYQGQPQPNQRIYNPTLVFYFLKQLQESGHPPRELLDHNLAMDRQKIAYISRLPNGEQVLTQTVNEEIPLVTRQLVNRFGVSDILYGAKDSRHMISLLYYFGVLTLRQQVTEWGELMFRIPNLVTKQLYVERIQELLLPTGTDLDQAQTVARQFYQTGNIAGICEFIEQKYFPLFDNRDYRWTNELTIKTIFMTVLFNDTFYMMDSETALQRDYSDLTMIVRPDMRRFKLMDFLFEFKYIPLAKVGLTGETVRGLSQKEFAELPLVRQRLTEATQKIQTYQQTLATQSKTALQLRSYVVLSVGYDRLLWREVTQSP